MTYEDFVNNPYFWTNNKRRMHGLKPIRKKKRNERFNEYKNDFYIAIYTELEKRVIKQIKSSELFKDFVDVKEVSLGDKVIYEL